MLLSCGGGEPSPPSVDAAPAAAWTDRLDLHDDERPPWPAVATVSIEGEPTRWGDQPVWLAATLSTDAPGCPSWPLPPLLLRDGRWTSSRALDPIEQRLEIRLDPDGGLVRAERIIDTPQQGPSLAFWPASWTLEASVDDTPVTLQREGDVVLWPPFRRLVLAGDGPLPDPARLDAQGLTLDSRLLVPDREAVRTGMAVIGSPFHIEPGRGQRGAGAELVVAGVRFPHHASGEGIRVLANDDSASRLLDELLALRSASPFPWPRPLFVIPGARDQRVGDTLALGPHARSDATALRRAVWELAEMDDALRRAFQALEGPPTPVVEPGCFGLRSRPALDRSPLLAQVLLVDPDAATAASWDELERRHPWLTAWLDAPAWPRLEVERDGDTLRWVDTANTGLPLRLPVIVEGSRKVIGLDEWQPASTVRVPAARLPVGP